MMTDTNQDAVQLHSTYKKLWADCEALTKKVNDSFDFSDEGYDEVSVITIKLGAQDSIYDYGEGVFRSINRRMPEKNPSFFICYPDFYKHTTDKGFEVNMILYMKQIK